jgi:hypothetical protein
VILALDVSAKNAHHLSAILALLVYISQAQIYVFLVCSHHQPLKLSRRMLKKLKTKFPETVQGASAMLVRVGQKPKPHRSPSWRHCHTQGHRTGSQLTILCTPSYLHLANNWYVSHVWFSKTSEITANSVFSDLWASVITNTDRYLYTFMNTNAAVHLFAWNLQTYLKTDKNEC